MKTVLVQGNFDLLHPGHIRLLKFARECGDHLIVAVNTDSAMEVASRLDQEHRLEMVRSLQCVDEALLTDLPPPKLVAQLQPSIVVKGKEFEGRLNKELDALQMYGGKLIFGSGEFDTGSELYVKRVRQVGQTLAVD